MARRATLETTADLLHSAAIHLLRRVRASDVETGLSPARLSLLSVLVFGGPRTPGELAAAEQVRPPTITALVRALEHEGLVAREAHPEDGRAVRIRATARGERLLRRARARRLDQLVALLEPLDRGELERLLGAARLLDGLLSERGRARAG